MCTDSAVTHDAWGAVTDVSSQASQCHGRLVAILRQKRNAASLPMSPASMNWTATSWPAVPWTVGSKYALKFAHVRTTRVDDVNVAAGCAAYGHTLWACVNSAQAIGLGWEWAQLAFPSNCLLVADVLSIASNLRFVDAEMERYVGPRRSVVHLNTLVAAVDWRAEVARQAGLNFG